MRGKFHDALHERTVPDPQNGSSNVALFFWIHASEVIIMRANFGREHSLLWCAKTEVAVLPCTEVLNGFCLSENSSETSRIFSA